MRNLHHFVSRHHNLLLYGIIGATGALLDFIIFALFYKFTHIPPGIASFISVSAGIMNNFILNARYNFKKRDRWLYRFSNFYLIGLAGALLSVALIVILVNGAGLNPLVAKLVTIIPVVFAQFLFNKKVSFQDLDARTPQHHPLVSIVKSHRAILVVYIIFISLSLSLIKTIPFAGAPDGAPDEITHYNYNVKFILDNHRLPVSGKDDIGALSTCTNDSFNRVPCLYSYQAFVPVNYIVSALGAWFIHSLTGISEIKSARLVSLLLGIVFIFFIYRACLLITRHRGVSASIAASIALIPQVIFVFSYTNQDAMSLAIASICLFAITALAKNPSKTNILFTGIAIGGLLPLSKLNYLLAAPLIIIVCALLLQRRYVSWAIVRRVMLYACISFVVIAAGWYIRNIILYHDPIGQSFVLQEMTKYHPLGQAHALLAHDTIMAFTAREFLVMLFLSFFLKLGFMTITADLSVYIIVAALLLAITFYIYHVASADTKKHRNITILICTLFLSYLLLAIAMVYYNSAHYDFQPQGRYLFPILPALAASCALLFAINKKYFIIIRTFLFIAIFLVGAMLLVFFRSYAS